MVTSNTCVFLLLLVKMAAITVLQIQMVAVKQVSWVDTRMKWSYLEFNGSISSFILITPGQRAFLTPFLHTLGLF